MKDKILKISHSGGLMHPWLFLSYIVYLSVHNCRGFVHYTGNMNCTTVKHFEEKHTRLLQPEQGWNIRTSYYFLHDFYILPLSPAWKLPDTRSKKLSLVHIMFVGFSSATRMLHDTFSCCCSCARTFEVWPFSLRTRVCMVLNKNSLCEVLIGSTISDKPLEHRTGFQWRLRNIWLLKTFDPC